jgi:hypothetical protein
MAMQLLLVAVGDFVFHYTTDCYITSSVVPDWTFILGIKH